MKPRWWLFALVGLAFGVLDWFVVQWTASSSLFSVLPVIWVSGFNALVWLIPILPVVSHTANRATAWHSAPLAGMLTWGCAVVSYYLFYALRLALGQVVGWEHLNIFAGKENGFWQIFGQAFKRLILVQTLEWLWVGLLGGFLIGLLVRWLRRSPGQA